MIGQFHTHDKRNCRRMDPWYRNSHPFDLVEGDLSNTDSRILMSVPTGCHKLRISDGLGRISGLRIAPKYNRWWIMCLYTILRSCSLSPRGWFELCSYNEISATKQVQSSISWTTTSRTEPDIATPVQTSIKETEAYIADCIIKSVPQNQSDIHISISSTRCEIMTWLSISRLRSLLSTFIPRVLSPKNRRETVLFGGPDPKRSSTLVCTKSDIPMMSREESILTALSGSGVPAQTPVLQRLHVGIPLFQVYTTL